MNYVAPVVILILVVSTLGCSSSTVRVLQPAHKLYYLQAQAAAGDPDAQFNLGYRYMTGREIRKNETTGVYWLMRAANQDHAAAQFTVGLSYRYGNGVTRNIERAIHWYTKSSAHGRPSALHELGDIYYNGVGVVQNYSIAVLCFFLAASQGYVDSQMRLGIAYALGQGVEQDIVEGHMYLNLASVRNQEAREARVILESNMTSGQVNEAQNKALNWEAKSWEEIKHQLEEALEEMDSQSTSERYGL